MSGLPGSGKSTELRRLAYRLQTSDTAPDGDGVATHVVFIDGGTWLDPFVPPSVSDLLRVLAYVVDREAEALARGVPIEQATPRFLDRLWDRLSAPVELKNVAVRAPGFDLMLELRANPNLRARVEAALSEQFQSFAREAHHAIEDAVGRIRQHGGVQRVVVIVDELEKFTWLHHEQRDATGAAVEALFLQHARWLQLPCHVVYTFPFWLSWRTAALGSAYDSAPVVLPMIKVRERDGAPCPAGLAKLAEMVGRRIDPLGDLFGPDLDRTLAPLLAVSGAYPREVVRLVRDVVLAADRFETLPVDGHAVAAVIRERALEYARVASTVDQSLLEEVSATRRLPAEGDARLLAARELVERRLVLGYQNGEEWYDVHPLVARAVGSATDG
jgi:hypothetical protein